MSRAGEGKNESSAGKRVIVAKGRAGQKGTMPLAVGIGELPIGWLLSRQQVGHANEARSTAQSHGVGRRTETMCYAMRISRRVLGQKSLVWRSE